MTHPPRITDESVLARWMGLEVAKLNGGIVQGRKSLSALLTEKEPSARTRDGGIHAFDPAVIAKLGALLPEEIHRRLNIPLLFYASPDVPDSCSCPDGAALEALLLLGEISSGRTLQGGRFWVSRPIVYAIMRKYPSAIQIVMGA